MIYHAVIQSTVTSTVLVSTNYREPSKSIELGHLAVVIVYVSKVLNFSGSSGLEVIPHQQNPSMPIL